MSPCSESWQSYALDQPGAVPPGTASIILPGLAPHRNAGPVVSPTSQCHGCPRSRPPSFPAGMDSVARGFIAFLPTPHLLCPTCFHLSHMDTMEQAHMLNERSPFPQLLGAGGPPPGHRQGHHRNSPYQLTRPLG